MKFIDYKIKYITEDSPHKVVRVIFYLGSEVNVVDPISGAIRKEYKREPLEVKDIGFSIADSHQQVINYLNNEVLKRPYVPRKELNINDIK